MANDREQPAHGILGDINPKPGAVEHKEGLAHADDEEQETADESMTGGSSDTSRHAGTRDVTGGPIGGTGTETGGTRNYRTGTGATGGDIGNRPE